MTPECALPDPERTAQKLLAKGGVVCPPVDVNELVSLWDNLFIVEEDLDGTGYLLPVGQLGAEILVNRSDSTDRKRFTIAHELGHWVLGVTLKKKVGEFAQPANVPRIVIEKWCDTFATNLLMPKHMVEATIPQPNQAATIDAILGAPNKFGVSDQAFYIRMWEILRLQVAWLAAVVGRSGGRCYSVERACGDKAAESDLHKMLCIPEIAMQLQGSLPLIMFSVTSESGPVSCIGRKVGNDRAILIVKWPDCGAP